MANHGPLKASAVQRKVSLRSSLDRHARQYPTLVVAEKGSAGPWEKEKGSVVHRIQVDSIPNRHVYACEAPVYSLRVWLSPDCSSCTAAPTASLLLQQRLRQLPWAARGRGIANRSGCCVLNTELCLAENPEPADKMESASKAKRESICYLECVLLFPEASRSSGGLSASWRH
jgi:hypothetical protein